MIPINYKPIDGFEYTGEFRPPLDGEFFESDIEPGFVVQQNVDVSALFQDKKIVRRRFQPGDIVRTRTGYTGQIIECLEHDLFSVQLSKSRHGVVLCYTRDYLTLLATAMQEESGDDEEQPVDFDDPATYQGDEPVDSAALEAGVMRQFETGATRNVDNDNHDYEGFLSPLVVKRFGEYMHSHREQADGTRRDSDNWQKGIPLDSYMKSGWRHFFDWWCSHREVESRDDLETALCALLFNVQGYLHETLKAR